MFEISMTAMLAVATGSTKTVGLALRTTASPDVWAPMATSALFTPRVMSAIFLSRQVPDEDAEELKDTPIGFITVEEGERWVAHYPITDSAKSLEDKISGMIYIYQGKLDGSRVSGKIHFGVEYEIIPDKGNVSTKSQIWMGSIFNLGRGLLVPADNRITLSEWFSFRPIPVIEGEHTDDPELLGIREHIPEEED